MIAAIIPWLITRGWSAEAAKRIGIAMVIGGIVLFAALFTWGGISFVRYVVHLRDRTISQQGQLDQANGQIAAQQQNDGFNGNESVAIARDAQDIAAQQKERDDAIAKAPAGATGPATRAANCVRWTRQHPSAPTPAACRGG